MEGVKVLRNIIANSKSLVSNIGQIKEYDYKTQMATVQVMLPFQGEELPLLTNIPTTHSSIYTHYEIGDIVILLFFDTNTDNVIVNGEYARHNEVDANYNDCVILGKIKTLDQDSNHEDNFIKFSKDDVDIQVNKDNINISKGQSNIIISDTDININSPVVKVNGRDINERY